MALSIGWGLGVEAISTYFCWVGTETQAIEKLTIWGHSVDK